MEVKAENGDVFNAAGAGTKGIAIAGLAAGAAALVGEGLLGGWNLLGNSRNSGNGNGNEFVTQKEFNYAQAYDNLAAELQKERSQRYTDSAVIAQSEVDEKIHEKLAQNVLDIGIAVTKIDQQKNALDEKLDLKDQILDLRMKALEDKVMGAISFESERRAAGDQSLFSYCNATFVPGKLFMPADSVSPEPMAKFNSWTAPTTTTTTTS